VDADGDIIRRGAFTKTIAEQGPSSRQPRIKHLLNHDPSQPLGVLTSLTEDDYGLAYESQIGSHDLGEDFIKMIESGLITEHSIGFQIVKRNRVQSWEDYQANPAGGQFEITEVKLYEGSSLTAWGANPMTPITSLKSGFDVDLFSARIQAIEKFCRNTTATDDTIQMLLMHSKQLAQYIIDMKGTDPVATNQPQTIILDSLREFNNSIKK
jgi:HK97 family phage prohead protease